MGDTGHGAERLLILSYSYSPAALSLPPPTLYERAQELAAACKTLEIEMGMKHEEMHKYLRGLRTSTTVEVMARADAVQCHATLTLVYRAMAAPEGSPTRFSSDCLDSARKAMNSHQDCIALMGHNSYIKSVYVHWYVPETFPSPPCCHTTSIIPVSSRID